MQKTTKTFANYRAKSETKRKMREKLAQKWQKLA